jgi:uncharacterized protein (DUF302 family)
MTKTELKQKFEHYYAHLKEDAKIAGYRVNKQAEWERWLEKAKETTN